MINKKYLINPVSFFQDITHKRITTYSLINQRILFRISLKHGW